MKNTLKNNHNYIPKQGPKNILILDVRKCFKD